ncbi:MAG: hypothetical protein RBG13Loki_3713 [Promethearchaeota archaeon CR_4]|nr:MAG: hypothetical protein RBG13Loki_3713 [Candidatus Lokiarchaeota archaeon CR_4]
MDYRDFVVYNLHDSGEISEIEVNADEVQKILDPKEVFMLVRQDMRRIFIWKGSVSPVRKRFISARRATLLQEDIRKSGGRALKIVSVDQGDEPEEFLETFHLESMPVTEVLEDMRYVRNVDRDAEAANPNVAAAPPEGSTAHGTAEEFMEQKKAVPKAPISISAESPAISGEPILFDEEEPAEVEKSELKKIPAKSKPKPPVRKVKPEPEQPITKTSTKPFTPIINKADEEMVLKDVLGNPVPAGAKRINVIIGNKLIGSILQQKSILGKSVESTVWGEFEELPNGCAEILGSVRIYTNQEKGIVVAEDLIQSDLKSKIEIKEDVKIGSEKPDEILVEVSKIPLPKGMKRLNVVLGSLLYGPVTQQKSVLGKSVEKLAWEQISDLPGGCVELQGIIRIFVDAEKGIVKAVDIFEGNVSDIGTSGEQGDESTTTKRRKLPGIPKGDN